MKKSKVNVLTVDELPKHECNMTHHEMKSQSDIFESLIAESAIGFRVLIKRDAVDIKSKGGIYFSDDTVKKNQGAQTIGTLVAVGPVAFTGPDWGVKDRDKLKIGTRVIYRRHSGQPFTTDQNDPDADRYEICADSDVYMPIPEGENLTFMKRD